MTDTAVPAEGWHIARGDHHELHVGCGDKAAYVAALRALVEDEVASRLAARDHTLWGPAAEEEAGKRLGWVGLSETSRSMISDIAELEVELREQEIYRVVLCGMGGSSLAPEVICQCDDVELVVLDSSDPDFVRAAIEDRLEETVVVVSSKSGGTVETDSQRRAFEKAFADAGIDATNRIVVVTDPGSPLEKSAREAGYRVFLADPEVGGRYSALTAFGLVPAGLAGALASVRETLSVDAAQAVLLGMYDEGDPDSAVRPDARGRIEVPRWRHAIVNYPHPLLELGLVVIDTPGLNAIGAEPELTLKLIPGADAVLFVLAADAGVTRSDIEVWREHISASHKSGRFVVLNKIDGLWDGLKDDVQLQLEIAQQVGSVAHALDLPNDRIYPVSAQKALVARVNRDPLLLKRSRMSDLEYALGRELVPQQREIAREHVSREFEALHSQVCATLGARRRAAVEQLFELGGLRGKNRSVMDHMAARIRRERDEFDRSLRQLQGLRAVLARHARTLGETVGGESLKRQLRQAREAMRNSSFSSGLRSGMNALIAAVHADFERASQLVDEAATLMSAMYRSFSAEHGLSLGNPALYSMRRFHAELERIDQLQRRQFGAITLATTSQQALMRRFFESVAVRLRELEETADREIQAWLRTVMSPIETQVREHQAQLKRRLDAVRRVLEANDSLESRIDEIERQRADVEQRIALAGEFALQVREMLGRVHTAIVPAPLQSAG